MSFPDDVNGDVLRRLAAQSDDLTRPRNIDFNVVFGDQDSAQRFAERFRALGYETLEHTGSESEFPWDVVVVAKQMLPSYEAITDFEKLLQTVATDFGGHNSGWGCFSE